MDRVGLSDLDERVFEVRDKTSRDLIREAIAAYRGGAYRSAIMSTWIAIAYDIIVKVRELAAHGEANAVAFTKELDRAISGNDVAKLQSLERDLLSKAKDDFQLLTEREHMDLERIYKDRHQCAHPAFVGDNVLFQPLPELVRNHIAQAIDILLSHAPMQGKSALEQLERDLFSPSFPKHQTDIQEFVKTRYVERVKDSGLVKVMQSIIGRLFGSDHAKYRGMEDQLAYVLKAFRTAKPALFAKEVEPWIRSKAAAVHDHRLLSLIPFSVIEPAAWQALDNATRAEVKAVIGSAPEEVFESVDIYAGLSLGDLKESMLHRFQSLSKDIQEVIIMVNPIPEFVPSAIAIYRNTKGYRSAEHNGKNLILPLSDHFEAEHIRQILEIAVENKQVGMAGESPEIFAELFDRTIDRLDSTKDHWKKFISAMGKGKKRDERYAYPDVRKRLKEHGIMKR